MNCVQNNRNNSKRVFSSHQNLRQHKILNETKKIPFEWLVCVKEKAPHYSNTNINMHPLLKKKTLLHFILKF